MEATLKNNAFALNQAIERSGHCAPGTALIRDGHHAGTLFTWLEDRWCVVDVENRELLGFHDRLAVVSLDPEADADNGLNQASLGMDMEVQGGEWVVDASDLEGLQETYGESLEVIWEQE